MLLAQSNLAIFRWPLDDVRMAEFVDQIEPVYQYAENSAGFIWRYSDPFVPSVEAEAPWNDSLLFFNMSVWQDLQSLLSYVRSPEHMKVVRCHDQWTRPVPDSYPSFVLWWIEESAMPRLNDAMTAFRSLSNQGETLAAFTVNSSFALQPPGGGTIR